MKRHGRTDVTRGRNPQIPEDRRGARGPRRVEGGLPRTRCWSWSFFCIVSCSSIFFCIMSSRFCFLSARPKRSENDSRDMLDMLDMFEPTEPIEDEERTLSAVLGRRSMVTLLREPTIRGLGPLRRIFDRSTGPTCGSSPLAKCSVSLR